MFGTQNLAISALPCGYVYHTYCGYYYSYCGYNYYSFRGYNYLTYHCAYVYITSLQPQQAVQCPGITAIPAPVGLGDPGKPCKRCDSSSRWRLPACGRRKQNCSVSVQLPAAKGRSGASDDFSHGRPCGRRAPGRGRSML